MTGKPIEKDVEERLRKGVEKAGGKCWKWVSPGNAGVPDRIVTIDGRTIFIELKTDTGRVRPTQKVQIRNLQKCGQDVRVLKGMKDVEEFLKELFIREVRDGV